MGKKKIKPHIEVDDLRVERLNVDGIVIKDKYTRKPYLKIPSLRGLFDK